MSKQRDLTQAAKKQVELVLVMQQTEYAMSPTRLHDIENHLDDLRVRMKTQSEIISDLNNQIVQEQKPQKSKSSKIFFSFGSKKSTEPKVEEPNATIAQLSQRQQEAKAIRESMLQEMKGLENEKKGILSDKQNHIAATADLEDLWNSVFDGPTPDIPGEDELEMKVKTLIEAVSAHQRKVDMEETAQRSLTESVRHYADAMQALDTAQGWFDAERAEAKPSKSMLKVWNDNQAKCMLTAQSKSEQAQWNYGQAARAQPLIPVTPFEGDSNAPDFQEKMKQATTMNKFELFEASKAVMHLGSEKIANIYKQQEKRLDEVKKEQKEQLEKLTQARKQLSSKRFQVLDEMIQDKP